MVLYSSPIQDYVYPDDQTQPTFEMTSGFKPFTDLCYYSSKVLNQNQGLKKVRLVDFFAGQLIFKLIILLLAQQARVQGNILQLTSKESNPCKKDTEGTTESVRIDGASVLSGSCY